MRGLRRGKATALSAGTLAVVGVLLFGCGNAAAHANSEAAKAATVASRITLVVQDGEANSAYRVATYKMLDSEFENAHPGVTIDHISKTFSQLTTTIKLQLSSPSAPDVTETNQGYGTMGVLVKAGLLAPLDMYAREWKWASRQPAGLLNMGRFSADGTKFGTGTLYGISATADTAGVYYNQTLLRKLKLALPTTLTRFEADLKRAQSAGITPIAFGTLGGGGSTSGEGLYGPILDSFSSPTFLYDLVYGRGTVSFDNAKTVHAASVMQSWATNGYLSKGFSGIAPDDAVSSFSSGKALFLVSGTWLNGDLRVAMHNNVGFFLLPQATTSAPPLATATGGLPWSISAKSKHIALAAQYINFITGKQAADLFVKRGDIAAMAVPAKLAPRGPNQDALLSWKKLSLSNGFAPYLDWATPTFYNTLQVGLQELLGSKLTPQQFVQNMNKDYSGFVKAAG